jgi:spermidine/putrescine transport system permease protein
MRLVRWTRENGISIFAGLVVLYMLIPIAVIAVFSFNDPAGKYNFTWQGFTLDHWGSAFSAYPDLTDALLTSLKLAALATVIATILGTMVAMALVRHQFRGRKLANLLIVIPMTSPEVVIGAALLSMFVYFQIDTGFVTLLIAHVMFSISFVVVVVRSRLIGFDRRLEEAARDLGADARTTLRTVTLPLIAPGLFAAALLAFALSLDDFVISNFNSGTTVTFPLYIFGAAQRGIPVEVNVLATMLFLLTVVAMGLTVWQQRRAEELAKVRPDQEGDTGFPALASGQNPVAQAGSAS